MTTNIQRPIIATTLEFSSILKILTMKFAKERLDTYENAKAVISFNTFQLNHRQRQWHLDLEQPQRL